MKKQFEFWLVAFDDTEHWHLGGDLKKHVERIDTVYLFNRLEQTFVAELYPSYYLRFVGSVPVYKDRENLPEEIAEKIEDELRLWQETDGIYVHCRQIEAQIQEEQARPLQSYRRTDGKVQFWQTVELDLAKETCAESVETELEIDVAVNEIMEEYANYAASNHEFATWRE